MSVEGAVNKKVASGALLPPSPPHDAPPSTFDAPTVVPPTLAGTLAPRSVPGQTSSTVLVGVDVLVAVDVRVGGTGVGVVVGGASPIWRLNVPLAVEYPSTTITTLSPATIGTATCDWRVPKLSSLQANSGPVHVTSRTKSTVSNDEPAVSMM